MVSGVTIQKEPFDQYLLIVKNLVPSFHSFPRSLSLSLPLLLRGTRSLRPWGRVWYFHA